jgi:hypothetical protein
MNQVTLQWPDPLLADVRRLAEQQHFTLEEFVTRLVEETVRANAAWAQYLERGKQVSRERFLEILAKVPDVEPDEGDRLE